MSDIAPCVVILPNVILLEIFKRLPLLDLFKSIGLVCRGWRALLYEHELLSRKTLVLFPTLDEFEHSECVPENDYHHHLLEQVKKEDGSPWMLLPTEAQIRFNFMPMRHFTSEALVGRNIMPNITDLTLIVEDVELDNYQHLIRLISLWSVNLISLKLTINRFENRFCNRIALAFFEQFNNIPSLRHFKLKIKSAYTPAFRHITLPENYRLSFLSHLHTFCLETDLQNNITNIIKNMNECLFRSVREHASENVNLKICSHNRIELDKCLPLDRQFARKFTQIHLCFDEEDQFTNEKHFFTSFTSLTSLLINIDQPYMLKKLSFYLQNLPNLVSLKILFTQFRENAEWDDPSGRYEHNYHVTSVRLLVIEYICTYSHRDIAKLSFPYIFPNVQVIQFGNDNRGCTDCDYNLEESFRHDRYFTLSPELVTKIHECARLAIEQFGECANLHTIQYNINPYNLSDDWNTEMNFITEKIK